MSQVLNKVFPQEYLDVMSDKSKTLFLNTLKKVLKAYPEKNDQGYRYVEKELTQAELKAYPKESVKTLTVYPALRDWKKPYFGCPLSELKAVVLVPEPFNNGEATGIPLQISMDYRPSAPLAKKQQDGDCVDLAICSNFSTYEVKEVEKLNKDGSVSKRKKKVYLGELVHGADWEYLLEQGILIIHCSITSEQSSINNEKHTFKHFKHWLPFTVEFLNCLHKVNNKLVLLTIGTVLEELFAKDSFHADHNLSMDMIHAPDAFFEHEQREVFRLFKPFKKLNEALIQKGEAPFYVKR
jgi:uracil DNA glycosylase